MNSAPRVGIRARDWHACRPWSAWRRLPRLTGRTTARALVGSAAVGILIVAACAVVVLRIMNPGMRLWPIWTSTSATCSRTRPPTAATWAPTCGGPSSSIDNWFPKFRLSGWAPDWYAGFPVGQYYFPVPGADDRGRSNLVMPYNVAFKLVTVSGPLMLPAAAYYFAKGMRAPWPAPPAFAIAAFGTLVQTRNDWQIYGGNIASTLAGEFSFTIGLAFALFALGALAYTLDTGKRRWLPAVLIAARRSCRTSSSRSSSAIAAILLWLTRRPQRTWAIAVPVGAVAGRVDRGVVAAACSWQQAIHAEHAVHEAHPEGRTSSCRRGSPLPGPGASTRSKASCAALDRPSTRTRTRSSTSRRRCGCRGGSGCSPGVAIVAAGWYRRRSTLVLLVLAIVIGVMFVSGPSTRSGTRGSCRSGCSRGRSSPRWARPRSLRLGGVGVRVGVRVDTRR